MHIKRYKRYIRDNTNTSMFVQFAVRPRPPPAPAPEIRRSRSSTLFILYISEKRKKQPENSRERTRKRGRRGAKIMNHVPHDHAHHGAIWRLVHACPWANIACRGGSNAAGGKSAESTQQHHCGTSNSTAL